MIELRRSSRAGGLGVSSTNSAFEVKTYEVRYFGPHKTIAGRVTGVVRARISEHFMGNVTDYNLDLKVRVDIGTVPTEQLRSALLAHAAHQIDRLRLRHSDTPAIAAE